MFGVTVVFGHVAAAAAIVQPTIPEIAAQFTRNAAFP